jgi:hypothetical protein
MNDTTGIPPQQPDPLLKIAKQAVKNIAEDQSVCPAYVRFLLDELIVFIREVKSHV